MFSAADRAAKLHEAIILLYEVDHLQQTATVDSDGSHDLHVRIQELIEDIEDEVKELDRYSARERALAKLTDAEKELLGL